MYAVLAAIIKGLTTCKTSTGNILQVAAEVLEEYSTTHRRRQSTSFLMRTDYGRTVADLTPPTINAYQK